ncbi:MAG: aminoacyl-tRNA hydrolase [Spirochaetes bacterium]|nr:aminoacyl-tRNA hydrolase [Spirochaetota bacterium]
MFVVACLGNPGKKYSKNRHNIGFMIGDIISNQYGIALNASSFDSITGRGAVEGREVLILLPQEYMNNSGGPIKKATDYYKVPPERLVVLHDDIELGFGLLQCKFGGGHKGHNGIRSIVQELGTPDFHRIRFGVGRPDHPDIGVADHVLSNFTAEEMTRIRELVPSVIDMLVTVMNTGG